MNRLGIDWHQRYVAEFNKARTYRWERDRKQEWLVACIVVNVALIAALVFALWKIGGAG